MSALEQNKAIVDGYYQAGVQVLGHPRPSAREALDFSSFRYESLTAEDDHVVAAITIGVTRSNATVAISEHWTLGDAVSLWVAYFEPQVLLDPLGIQHGLREN